MICARGACAGPDEGSGGLVTCPVGLLGGAGNRDVESSTIIALVVNGVHLLENLKLDELVAKNVQEFAFIMTALKIRGATGSTVSPIAVH